MFLKLVISYLLLTCNIILIILDGWAFSNTALLSIEFPANISVIESGVFSGCANMSSINIPTSVTRIGTLYHHLHITTIMIIFLGNNAFSFCTNLTSVNIPTSVTAIGTFPRSNFMLISI
jgi:hypothetical protein